MIYESIPELKDLDQLMESSKDWLKSTLECNIKVAGIEVPLYRLESTLCDDPGAPVFLLVGGVHGLERIGSQVVISFLRTLSGYMKWDKSWQEVLKKVKIVCFPILNPGGFYEQTRSNPNGVDLMRNAPLDAEGECSMLRLYQGHRISNRLPWYRGELNKSLELESQVLVNWVLSEGVKSKAVLALDVHSGFGSVDRVWFPFAGSSKPFESLGEVWALKNIIDDVLPYHIYKIEPQSKVYTTHGDLWDYLYRQTRSINLKFIPLTLEMGSWAWLRKNFFRSWNILYLFHPVKAHRVRRVLRRHFAFLELLLRLSTQPEVWSDKPSSRQSALEYWEF